MRPAAEPTDEELVVFADSLLADLGEQLREPVVVLESVRENRELWLMLYQVAHDAADGDGSAARRAGAAQLKFRLPGA